MAAVSHLLLICTPEGAAQAPSLHPLSCPGEVGCFAAAVLWIPAPGAGLPIADVCKPWWQDETLGHGQVRSFAAWRMEDAWRRQMPHGAGRDRKQRRRMERHNTSPCKPPGRGIAPSPALWSWMLPLAPVQPRIPTIAPAQPRSPSRRAGTLWGDVGKSQFYWHPDKNQGAPVVRGRGCIATSWLWGPRPVPEQNRFG